MVVLSFYSFGKIISYVKSILWHKRDKIDLMGQFYYLLIGRLTFLLHFMWLCHMSSHSQSGTDREYQVIQGLPDSRTVQLRTENGFQATIIYYDHSNCVKSAIISLIGISSFSLSPNALYISSTSSLLSGKSPTFVKIALNSRLLWRFSKKFETQTLGYRPYSL